MSRTPTDTTARLTASGAVGRLGFADGLTIANGITGLLVIATVLAARHGGQGLSHGRLLGCAALIVLGGMFDCADGVVAHWRGGSGMGGALDTMSDALTFGVAPGVILIAQAQAAVADPWRELFVPVAVLFVAATMVRLARNCTFPAPFGRAFLGLPMPGAAGGVLSLVLLRPPAPVLLLGVVVLSALMVSELRYTHPDRRSSPLLAATWIAAAGGITGLLPVWPAAALCLTVVVIAPLAGAGVWPFYVLISPGSRVPDLSEPRPAGVAPVDPPLSTIA